MKFIELLKEKQSEHTAGGFRMFHGIEIDPITLSVQASALHYCEPRETLDSLDIYTEWEVGIVGNGRLMRPEECGLAEFSEYFEAGPKPVAGYVPTEIVQRIYDTLVAQGMETAK